MKKEDQTMVTPLDEKSTLELEVPMSFEGQARTTQISINRSAAEQGCAVIVVYESTEDIRTPESRTDHYCSRRQEHPVVEQLVLVAAAWAPHDGYQVL
jgi:hypothetical protein